MLLVNPEIYGQDNVSKGDTTESPSPASTSTFYIPEKFLQKVEEAEKQNISHTEMIDYLDSNNLYPEIVAKIKTARSQNIPDTDTMNYIKKLPIKPIAMPFYGGIEGALPVDAEAVDKKALNPFEKYIYKPIQEGIYQGLKSSAGLTRERKIGSIPIGGGTYGIEGILPEEGTPSTSKSADIAAKAYESAGWKPVKEDYEAEGFTGKLVQGLFEFAPQMFFALPVFRGISVGLGSIAEAGIPLSKAANWLLKAGEHRGAIERALARGSKGALTGFNYGALTAEENKVIEKAINDATGFAIAEVGFGALGDILRSGKGIKLYKEGEKKPSEQVSDNIDISKLEGGEEAATGGFEFAGKQFVGKEGKPSPEFKKEFQGVTQKDLKQEADKAVDNMRNDLENLSDEELHIATLARNIVYYDKDNAKAWIEVAKDTVEEIPMNYDTYNKVLTVGRNAYEGSIDKYIKDNPELTDLEKTELKKHTDDIYRMAIFAEEKGYEPTALTDEAKLSSNYTKLKEYLSASEQKGDIAPETQKSIWQSALEQMDYERANRFDPQGTTPELAGKEGVAFEKTAPESTESKGETLSSNPIFNPDNYKKFINFFGKGKKEREILDVPHSESMSLISKVWNDFEYQARKYPSINKTRSLQMDRTEKRNDGIYQASQLAKPYYDLTKADKKAVNQLLVYNEGKPDVFTKEQLLRAGLTEQQADGFYAVKNNLKYVQDFFIRELDLTPEQAEDLFRISNFIPHYRRGDYKVNVYAKKADGSKGDVKYSQFIDDLENIPELKKETQAKYPDDIVLSEKVQDKLPESIYQTTNAASIMRILNEAIGKKAEGKLSPELITEIKNKLTNVIKEGITDTFKARGARSHFIKRQGGQLGIEGWDVENLDRGLFDYTTGMIGMATKAKFMKDSLSIIAEIPREDKRLYDTVSKYIIDMTRNADVWDKNIGMFRGWAGLTYLGGNLKFVALQGLQNYLTAYPVLSTVMKDPFKKLHSSMLDIATLKVTGKSNKITDEEMSVLSDTLHKKQLQSSFFQDLERDIRFDSSNETLQSIGKIATPIKAVLAYLPEKSENFNREATFLAAYREFRNQDFSVADAQKQAVDIVFLAHFDYSKAGRHEISRGGSVASKVANVATTFVTFSHKYLQLLGYLLEKGEYGALAKAGASLVAIGGVGSIPFSSSIIAPLYRKAAGQIQGFPSDFTPIEMQKKLDDDVDKWMKSFGYPMNDYGRKKIRDAIRYGIPGLFGVSLQGSTGIEMPGSLAATIGLVKGIGEGFEKSADMLQKGQGVRALEELPIIPVAFQNLFKGARLGTEGITTRTGKDVNQLGEHIILDKPEMIAKMMSFQPVKLADINNMNMSMKKVKEKWEAEKSDIVAEARFATLKGSDKDLIKAWDKIEKFNEKINRFYNKNQVKIVTPITGKTVQGNRENVDTMLNKEQLMPAMNRGL